MRHITALTLVIVLASFNCIAQEAPSPDYLGAGILLGLLLQLAVPDFLGRV